MPPQPHPFAFGASASPTAPPNSQPQPGAQPLDPMALIAQLLGGTQQPQQQTSAPDLGGMLAGIRQAKDPQGAANKGYVPGQDNKFSPFSNGFFKTADQRQQIEQDRLGVPGFSSVPQAQQGQLLQQHIAPNNGVGAINANPMQSLIHPIIPSPLTSPSGTPANDALNLQQSQGLYAPGGAGQTPWNWTSTSPSPVSGHKVKPVAKGSPAKSPFSFGF